MVDLPSLSRLPLGAARVAEAAPSAELAKLQLELGPKELEAEERPSPPKIAAPSLPGIAFDAAPPKPGLRRGFVEQNVAVPGDEIEELQRVHAQLQALRDEVPEQYALLRARIAAALTLVNESLDGAEAPSQALAEAAVKSLRVAEMDVQLVDGAIAKAERIAYRAWTPDGDCAVHVLTPAPGAGAARDAVRFEAYVETEPGSVERDARFPRATIETMRKQSPKLFAYENVSYEFSLNASIEFEDLDIRCTRAQLRGGAQLHTTDGMSVHGRVRLDDPKIPGRYVECALEDGVPHGETLFVLNEAASDVVYDYAERIGPEGIVWRRGPGRRSSRRDPGPELAATMSAAGSTHVASGLRVPGRGGGVPGAGCAQSTGAEPGEDAADNDGYSFWLTEGALAVVAKTGSLAGRLAAWTGDVGSRVPQLVGNTLDWPFALFKSAVPGLNAADEKTNEDDDKDRLLEQSAREQLFIFMCVTAALFAVKQSARALVSSSPKLGETSYGFRLRLRRLHRESTYLKSYLFSRAAWAMLVHVVLKNVERNEESGAADEATKAVTVLGVQSARTILQPALYAVSTADWAFLSWTLPSWLYWREGSRLNKLHAALRDGKSEVDVLRVLDTIRAAAAAQFWVVEKADLGRLRKRTLLWWAAARGHSVVATRLLEAGANPLGYDRDFTVPLQFSAFGVAVLQEHEALAELIGKYGGARHLQPKNPDDVVFHRGLNSTLRALVDADPARLEQARAAERAEAALQTASRRWATFLKQDPELEEY